jgi:hypothetical protein
MEYGRRSERIMDGVLFLDLLRPCEWRRELENKEVEELG